jgi:protein-disulfide isomerase
MANKDSVASGAASARQVAADLRAKQNAAARRRTALFAIGALVLLGVFIATIAMVVKSGNKATGEYQLYDASAQATPGAPIAVPSAADSHGGILIGQDGTVGGSVPADAVRVDIYEDPLCPICGIFVEMTTAEITSLRENGDIALYYHPISFLDYQSAGTQYSTRAVSAMATIAEYDPANFEGFVAGLFANQTEEGAKGLTNTEIADIATAAGVSASAIAKISEGEFTPWVAAATEQSSVDGIGGTPALLIGGVLYQGWSSEGNITGAVAYVKQYGAAAFQTALNEAAAAAASPSPSS